VKTTRQSALSAQKTPVIDLSPPRESMIRGGDVPVGRLLEGLAAFPTILKLLQDQQQQIAILVGEVRELRSKVTSPDGWVDAKGARAHLANMSKPTFDKYLRETSPKIKGYKTDGRLLFDKEELDRWVRLYDLKSRGEA
jgi:hypothetical protein